MKWTFGLILAPGLAFAGKIPVKAFDQSKLEQIISRIPSALTKIEERNGFVRRHYLFPSSKSSLFTIQCHADYYQSATIPSFKSCEVNVTGEPDVGDEYLLKIVDRNTVAALYSAITYGQEIKKINATEVIYAQSHTGKYKNIFRYSFVCQKESCEITFATKEATY
jgi:hypothetical protein